MTDDKERLETTKKEEHDYDCEGSWCEKCQTRQAAHDAEVERRATDEALRWAKQMIDLHGIELGRAEIFKRIAASMAEGKRD
jgi:hypothetical protein